MCDWETDYTRVRIYDENITGIGQNRETQWNKWVTNIIDDI